MKSQGIVGVSLMVKVRIPLLNKLFVVCILFCITILYRFEKCIGFTMTCVCVFFSYMFVYSIQIGHTTNSEFQMVTNEFNKLLYKGNHFNKIYIQIDVSVLINNLYYSLRENENL